MREKNKSYSIAFTGYVTKVVVLDGHKMMAVYANLDIPYMAH